MDNIPKTAKIAKKKIVNNQDTASGHKIEKANKVVTSEEYVNDNISGEVTTLSEHPLAKVTYSKKKTINNGNFEFTSVEIGVTLHCDPRYINKTYGKAQEFVESRLELEVEEIYKKNDSGDFV